MLHHRTTVDVGKMAAQRAGRQRLVLEIVQYLAPDRRGERLERRVELRSEEHTSELQSLMRISYAVFCLKNKKTKNRTQQLSMHETRSINTTRRQTNTIAKQDQII